jgi:BirA family biotin operon repressor/biotin-[acetyl-CoA-carboxylase] ligase
VLHHLEKVDSTNAYLQYFIASSAELLPEGFTVVADEQFAGKGQLGASWEAAPGQNLTASFLLYAKFLSPKQVFYLNKAVALAVRDCVSGYAAAVKIKWPNDIYVDDRKIAGILIENSLSTNAVQQSIIGVGINVNQTEFDAALPNPVSMRMFSKKVFALEEILHVLCSEIEKKYLLLRSMQFSKIDDAFHEHLLGMNQEKIFMRGDEMFSGTIRGVNENGKLLVETDKNIFEFGMKEVRMLG